MPELAEVEYYRKQWDPGLGQKVVAAEISGKRVFRGEDLVLLQKTLAGAALRESQAHGKQMLFRFTREAGLGVHLGMTGELRIAPPDTARSKHDHLVLRQRRYALIFTDPRQFGRVLFHVGPNEPPWWSDLPPAILSTGFTIAHITKFLARRARAPIKAVLLMQETFPGIGNWMADEILWQGRINPRRPAGSLRAPEIQRLHSVTRSITRAALKTVGIDWGDLPKKWLFHRRWRRGGSCPRDSGLLRHATIGGRTTCWCPKCQT